MARRRGHNEGSVYQRTSDGRWVAAVSVVDQAGRVQIVRRYRKTRPEAAVALRELQRQHDDGVQLTVKTTTAERFMEQWLEASARPSVRSRTYNGYESIVRVRIVPRIGRLKMNQVTPARIQKLYADLAADGLTPRSIINTHRVFRRALGQAVRWGLLVRNPCDAVDTPQARRTEMKTLTRDQVESFLAFAADSRNHALYVLALTTGMRLGELLGLHWHDIDLDAGRLRVVRSLQAIKGEGLVFTEPKTSRSRRTITLSRRAVAALREHRQKQLQERLSLGGEWLEPDLVFPDRFGGRYAPSTVSYQFKMELKRSGLPMMRFHDMRHTAATLLFKEGAHPKLVGDMLGHSSIALTLDTYSHVIPGMHDQLAATMDRLFGS